MQSISGLITQLRTTIGERPPILLGASVTIVEDRVFVFAGADQNRRMTNNMYVLDIKTREWTKLSWNESQAASKDKLQKSTVTRGAPRPRYFHSASVYKNNIVIFGGMYENQVTLQDVYKFDTETLQWTQIETQADEDQMPIARYAHLSTVVEDKLLVIGGQTKDGTYIEQLCMLDLETYRWSLAKSLEKRIGSYGSYAVTAPMTMGVHTAIHETDEHLAFDDASHGAQGEEMTNASTISSSSSSGSLSLPTPTLRQSQPIDHERSSTIYIYSNQGFSDVRRELQVIYTPATTHAATENSTPLDIALSLKDPSLHLTDCSKSMGGSLMPQGLRFPSGHVLGDHIVMAGTYIVSDMHSYMVYVFNTNTLEWSWIDTGTALVEGSWNRGVLNEETNQLIVFGDRTRSLVDDYHHRYLNFADMAVIHLEAFGIYRPPKRTSSPLAQEMGLSLLKEPAIADFRVVARDNQVILVNATVLRQRWPYFADKTRNFYQTNVNNSKMSTMTFPYPYDVALAFLQFIYTDNLWTPLQLQPHILAQLLLLAVIYKMPRLRDESKHRLHQLLDTNTASLVFEAASLSLEANLQIRALRVMRAVKKQLREEQLRNHWQTSPSSIHQRLDDTGHSFGILHDTSQTPAPIMREQSISPNSIRNLLRTPQRTASPASQSSPSLRVI